LPFKGSLKALKIPLFGANFGVANSPFKCKKFPFLAIRYTKGSWYATPPPPPPPKKSPEIPKKSKKFNPRTLAKKLTNSRAYVDLSPSSRPAFLSFRK
jgi:hypothetical protein